LFASVQQIAFRNTKRAKKQVQVADLNINMVSLTLVSQVH